MARILKADSAPRDIDTVSLASGTYELPFETEDEAILASARSVSFLTVEEDNTEADVATQEVDPNDPHQNPAADHLSASADPSAVEAARRNNALITGQADETPEGPAKQPVADSLRETFETLGIQEDPALPDVSAPVQEPPATVADQPQQPAPIAPRPTFATTQDGDNE